MEVKHSSKVLQNRAFTYFVKDYDAKNKIYTLENPITKDIRKISKEEFDKVHGGTPAPSQGTGFHHKTENKSGKH